MRVHFGLFILYYPYPNFLTFQLPVREINVNDNPVKSKFMSGYKVIICAW